ncbi:MAG: hydroxyacid dehydrogenase [Opitutaceae bacterium]|nr:hydroxyacid dehydrogenase [Opitutaceae bacterium]
MPSLLPPICSRQRILVALTPRERSQFFSVADAASLEAGNVHWATPEEMSPEAWHTTVTSGNPEVLVSAWATPTLPEAWLASPSCPLRYVCHVTGSVRRLVPRVFLERCGLVTNWGGLVSPQVAEHALLLALGSLRNLPTWKPFIAQPIDERCIREINTLSLFGRTVGLHGFGGVARAIIPLLRPFGTRILGYSAGVPGDVLRSVGVEPAASLEELFSASEVLFECESLTPATYGCVTREILRRLPHDAVFVNVARGGLVDEHALVEAAHEKRIRVAVDVSDHEPLTPAAPICQIPEVLASPHIAAPTHDQYPHCGARALHNLRCYLKGKPTPDLVDLIRYDRAT